MDFKSISAETKATVLLTTRLGEVAEDQKPLSPAEFRSVQNWLGDRRLGVGDLLAGGHRAAVNAMIEDGVGTPSIPSMLERVPKLVRMVERWAEAGIWVIGETDDAFPERLRHRLGSTGFPLLFGAGRMEFLNSGGVYIVGSRTSSGPGLQFSRTLAGRCGAEGITVISSDMRGADREAMGAAGATGGNIVCVLSDSLEKAVAAKRHRKLLERGILTVITPFSPDTRFRVANAIRVNRYQYCLADFAVIVETRRTGGVWLGAEENRKENWVPAFVRAEGNVPLGNEALLSLGLMSLTESDISECDSIGEYLISRLTLRSDPPHSGGPATASLNDGGGKLFDIFCGQLTSFADTVARSLEEIQDHFEIEPEQAKVWIARALEGGQLEEIGDAGRYRARQKN
jgi:predicted Rossmann fold nucleotide-binding protein DprA/Smf involved in DNA uptake